MSDWLESKLAYLKGLKSPNEQQQLLMLIAEKPESKRTKNEIQNLTLLIRAEKALEKAQKAKANVAKAMNAEKVKARKARDHELYNSAGLLIMAGLVDTKTGMPTMDRGELLGALLGLAKVPLKDPRRSDWKNAGDALLAK